MHESLVSACIVNILVFTGQNLNISIIKTGTFGAVMKWDMI